jgi:hypothetical protein
MARRTCKICGADVGSAEFETCGRHACQRAALGPGADDDRQPTRCVHCGQSTSEGRVCASCMKLIADIAADDYVEPPPRRHVHDARWMLWACNKRGKLREAQAIGRELGLHRNILRWSVEQVALVTAALVAAKHR